MLGSLLFSKMHTYLFLYSFPLFLILWCQYSVHGHTLFYRLCVLCLHWEIIFLAFCNNSEVFGTIVHFLCRQVIFHSIISLYFLWAEMCSQWPSVMAIVLHLALRIVILLLPWHTLIHVMHTWIIHKGKWQFQKKIYWNILDVFYK